MKWIFERFGKRSLPTSELYGLSPRFPVIGKSRRKMGEAFAVGASMVAVRLPMAVAGRNPDFWLIDDDLDALINDPSVPSGYRQRIGTAWKDSVSCHQWDNLKAVIVPSDRLAEIHGQLGGKVIRLDPSWPIPMDMPSAGSEGGKEVVALGTGSHAGDIGLLRAALENPSRTWNFNHFMGKHAPAWLERLPRIRSHPPLPWASYKKSLPLMKFDVCVYPCRATSLNEARSCNKIMEHAMIGAPALYSSCVPFADHVKAISGDLLVDGDWTAAIEQLIQSGAARRQMAEKSHRYALELAANASASQAALWDSIARNDMP